MSFEPAPASHATVGAPIALVAVSSSTNYQPVTVEFFVGAYATASFDNGYSWISPSGSQFTMISAYPLQLKTISELGTVAAAPYSKIWTPTQVGSFVVWAKATSAAGEVHDTPKTQITIYPENDDFENATVIPPDATTANFFFTSFLGSTEADEPAHKFAPASKTLWWKWTPSRSAKVRLKAVQGNFGLPLDVFVETISNSLHTVANNGPNDISISGRSGFVKLNVKAGQTYYIRTDRDTRRPEGLYADTAAPLDCVLSLEPANAPLPGELNFSLVACGYLKNGLVKLVPIARVFNTDRRTPLVGTQYRAQLFVGTSPRTLAPIGESEPFYPGATGYGGYDASFSGLFSPAPMLVPGTLARQQVFAQIRVWDSTFGETFETAKANGSPWGISNTVRVKTGSEETGGAMLLGIRNFSLQPGARR